MTSSLDNDTPLRRWLAQQPGRCPGCGAAPVQGHAAECLYGPRAWFHLCVSGWVHNSGGDCPCSALAASRGY